MCLGPQRLHNFEIRDSGQFDALELQRIEDREVVIHLQEEGTKKVEPILLLP
jgi:hypothetical protein